MKYSILFFFFISCMSDISTPDGTLKDFIEARFQKSVDREYILSKVTGKMRQSFENLNDEDFEKYANLKNIKRDSFKILSKSCQEKRCFITYTIKYTTSDSEKPTFQTEVKKIAELSWYEGKWFIADVVNMKTYHDSFEPLNPLDVTETPESNGAEL